jgi:DNA-directed RNA polymerase subunit RPC12/RpoP
MANSFLKGIGSVVNKAQANIAVLDLEGQRKAKENTVKQQMQALKDQRENIYARIGKEYFAVYRDDLSANEQFKDLIEALITNEGEMAAQEKQLEDINNKYNEEIRLLKGEGKVGEAKCPKCGAAYKPGVNLFCTDCGEDLRKKAPEGATCPNCGAAYVPGSIRFCKSCGHKLVEE